MSKRRKWPENEIAPWDEKASALDTQVAGDHYKQFPIQPLEYALANQLGICEHAVVKYVTRHSKKGGADDIRKAIHYCQIILEKQYGAKE